MVVSFPLYRKKNVEVDIEPWGPCIVLALVYMFYMTDDEY